MKFASAVCSDADSTRAVEDLFGQISGLLDPGELDLLLFFCTPHFEDQVEGIRDLLASRAPQATLLGCTAEGTIGSDQELQRSCSMSVLGGCLPGVRIQPFHLTQEEVELTDDRQEWSDLLGLDSGMASLTVILGDPFSFQIQEFLEKTNEVLPGTPFVGGMASAAEQPGQNRLILGREVHHQGLVGVTLSGDFSLRTVVSQGCQPIGEPFVVTKGEDNVIRELGGHPTLTQLRQVIEGLSEQEIALARQALFMGRAINEYQESFSRGDFLIHNIIGMDPAGGALAIAGPVRVGSTVQFHVRDADCADEDLRSLLGGVMPSCAEAPPAAALLFSCNGRGIRMWPEEGHDAGALREVCGPIPVAGFFAAGEIGPVGGRNFVHGFTASIALLGPA
ncbi:MAG: FIST signal transduction protein [Planctomycetota bacterium]